jgi:DNA-binding transcriptional regulator GbsR (MarR family)
MEELIISRGNANMNIRALIDWGLVQKELIVGERKEFFSAKKETWEIARQIAKERKRRELEPLLAVLSQLQNVEGKNDQVKEFKKVTNSLHSFAKQSESALNIFIGANASWFFKIIDKLKI